MKAAGKRWIIHPSRSDKFRLWDIADTHCLNKACSLPTLKRDIAEIAADPFSFWFSGGDLCEFIGVHDKRWCADNVSSDVPVSALGNLGRWSCTYLRDLFWPIKDKCLGMLFGNHERRFAVISEQEDFHSWLCTELDVPNLTFSARFDLIFVRNPRCKTPKLITNPGTEFAEGRSSHVRFRIFAHHGAGAAQTAGGKINRLVSFMQSHDADVYFVSHVHDKSAKRISRIGTNEECTELIASDRLGVVCGSYLRTYAQDMTTYGEEKGYAPTAMGAAIVTFDPHGANRDRRFYADV